MDVEEIVKLNLHPDDFVIIKAPDDRWEDIRRALVLLKFPYRLPVLFMRPDEDIFHIGKIRAEQILKDLHDQAQDFGT